jgi:hypothetical protein
MKQNLEAEPELMRIRAQGFMYNLIELYRLFNLAVGKNVPALKGYIYEAAADHR